jgi:hypothetical protein
MDPNAMMGQVPPKQQEELMKAIDQMQVRDRYVDSMEGKHLVPPFFNVLHENVSLTTWICLQSTNVQ